MRFARLVLILLPAIWLMSYTTPAPGIREAGFEFPLSNNSISTVYADGNSASAAEKYAAWNLQAYGLSQNAFEWAVKGFHYLESHKQLRKTNLLTIIDYSQPSTQKRLYVLDMVSGKLLFHTLVAHGKNSGYNYAGSFSNEEESLKSSLGFFVTKGTYTGANGYSLKLKGCEPGINDKALERAIVMHGADYVSQDFIRSQGYLGRSYGCPAVPVAVHKKLIDKLKNGSCIFLYYPAKNYVSRSKILDN